jgi:hypothetical protein
MFHWSFEDKKAGPTTGLFLAVDFSLNAIYKKYLTAVWELDHKLAPVRIFGARSHADPEPAR